ncbi:hypothetical protein DPMN_117814 [Dreissena polymorpha]|uniref:Uncharacterized protein n=1 Tax=Dreissena polymorpha TaxID=45954 RepID=A0A9D4GFD4_DREPO|nr:hypothetical protein DPMN_117814 [Dreissena polymorpha]
MMVCELPPHTRTCPLFVTCRPRSPPDCRIGSISVEITGPFLDMVTSLSLSLFTTYILSPSGLMAQYVTVFRKIILTSIKHYHRT